MDEVDMGRDQRGHRALNAHSRRCVAVEACVDERTVDKYLNKGTMSLRSTTRARVESALSALGWGYLVTSERVYLDAWADGYVMGLLYRGALWSADASSDTPPGVPPALSDLRAAGIDRYAAVLQTVARWRSSGCWALVLWAEAPQFGGRSFFCVERYGE